MAKDPHQRLAAELRSLTLALRSTAVDDRTAGELASAIAELRGGIEGDPVPGRRRRWGLYHGAHNPLAVPLEVERAEGENGPLLVGTLQVEAPYEGPPGHVHGGYLAGLFDDLLGSTQRLVRSPIAVTGRLTVRYRRPTPLRTPLELRAWIDADRGRRLIAVGECRVAGRVTAEAEGLFVRLSGPLPEPQVAL